MANALALALILEPIFSLAEAIGMASVPTPTEAAYFGIWWWYFKVSVRVRNTYGPASTAPKTLPANAVISAGPLEGRVHSPTWTTLQVTA